MFQPRDLGSINDPDEILTEWKTAKEQLDYWKARESAARDLVVASRSGRTSADAGTENIDIGHDHILKIVRGMDYKIDKTDDFKKLHSLQDEMEKSESGAVYSERLIKWEPKLMKSEYDKLPESWRVKVDEILTITPKKPTIELVPPKSN